MVAMDAREAIHKRRADRPAPIVRGHQLRRVDRSEDRRAGEHADERVKHILRAAELIEPVVNKGKGQGSSAFVYVAAVTEIHNFNSVLLGFEPINYAVVTDPQFEQATPLAGQPVSFGLIEVLCQPGKA